MESYTQDDVEGIRKLIMNEDFKKLQRFAQGRIDALRRQINQTLADTRLTAEGARMTQLFDAGEIQGLSMFVQKPERMLKQLINDPAPPEKKKAKS